MRQGCVVRLVALSVLLSTFALSSVAAESFRSISGTWEGLYQGDSGYIRITLQVPDQPERPDSFNGQLTLVPATGSSRGAPSGSSQVAMQYDASARSLTIVPDYQSHRSLGFRLSQFVGVIDDEQQLIAGSLVEPNSHSSPFFLLGRAGTADRTFIHELEQRANRASRPSSVSGLGNVLRLVGGGVNEKKLRDWVSPFVTQYPDFNAYSSQQAKVYELGRSLFRDEFFVPHFGKSYDQLNLVQLDQIAHQIDKIHAPNGNSLGERAAGLLRSVSAAFATGPSSAAPDIRLSVIAMRAMSAWRRASLQRIRSAPPTPESWKTLAYIERAEATAFESFWPQERKEFAEAVSSARSAAAAQLLTHETESFIQSASGKDPQEVGAKLSELRTASTAPSIQTARRSRGPIGVQARVAETDANASVSIGNLARFVPADARQASIARLEAQLGTAMQSECAADRQQVRGFGDGVHGLEASGRAYDDLSRKYGSISTGDSECAVFMDIAAGRASMLRAAESALSAKIESSSAQSDVAQLLRTYLSVPSDRSEPAGARLLQLAGERDNALKLEAERLAEQKKLRERMGACFTAETSAQGREPSERDMCVAVLVVLNAKQGEFDQMKEACPDVQSGGRGDAGKAIVCLMGQMMSFGGGLQLTIREFSKVACVSADSRGYPGYFCDFAMHINSGNSELSWINRIGGGEVTTGRFVSTRGLWIFIPQGNAR